MNNILKLLFYVLILSVTLIGCKKKSKQQADEIYSRHLQEHVKLSIISTPMPDDKKTLNLLLLNDGQDISKFRVKEIIDSLYNKNVLQPLVVVAIHAPDKMKDYGVAGTPDYKNNGSKADKYSAFIDNELYDFVKKKAGVRKFKTVVIAGNTLGGLSALDIAWDNADKIDKVGVFSGAFWWRDKDVNDKDYTDDKNRIMINKIRSSRKRPKLQYWFYAGAKEENTDRDKDGITDVADDTQDLIAIIKNKNIVPASDVNYIESPTGTQDYNSWSKALPSFLLWAFGK